MCSDLTNQYHCLSIYRENNTSSLIKTMRETIHEGKTTFQCESCDYSCALKTHMTQHITSVHEGEIALKCEFCDMNFSKKDNLV